MYCRYCGNVLKNNFRFCVKCGAEVKTPNSFCMQRGLPYDERRGLVKAMPIIKITGSLIAILIMLITSLVGFVSYSISVGIVTRAGNQYTLYAFIMFVLDTIRSLTSSSGSILTLLGILIPGVAAVIYAVCAIIMIITTIVQFSRGISKRSGDGMVKTAINMIWVTLYVMLIIAMLGGYSDGSGDLYMFYGYKPAGSMTMGFVVSVLIMIILYIMDIAVHKTRINLNKKMNTDVLLPSANTLEIARLTIAIASSGVIIVLLMNISALALAISYLYNTSGDSVETALNYAVVAILMSIIANIKKLSGSSFKKVMCKDKKNVNFSVNKTSVWLFVLSLGSIGLCIAADYFRTDYKSIINFMPQLIGVTIITTINMIVVIILEKIKPKNFNATMPTMQYSGIH